MKVIIAILATMFCVGRSFGSTTSFEFHNGFGGMGQVTQISPDSRSSEPADNHKIVEVNDPHNHGGSYLAYLFDGSTVYVQVTGSGWNSWSDVLTVKSILVSYNKKTTDIMSVTWSDQRQSYLITFEEEDAVHCVWLDLNSDVFKQTLTWDKNEPIGSVKNKTVGLDFEAQKR